MINPDKSKEAIYEAADAEFYARCDAKGISSEVQAHFIYCLTDCFLIGFGTKGLIIDFACEGGEEQAIEFEKACLIYSIVSGEIVKTKMKFRVWRDVVVGTHFTHMQIGLAS